MSERKLASVQRIAEIKPIEGADAIEAARINGWWVVVKKEQFAVGEMVVYCEVDSWIPHNLAAFLSRGKEPREFAGIKGERLRTVKLRGQLSQGLILSMLDAEIESGNPLRRFQEGEDISGTLGIVKYEPPVPAHLDGQVRGTFPSWIRKTDQERCQNLGRELNKSFIDHDEYEITVKLDGSSGTFYFRDGEIGVCSRNQELKINEENAGNTFVKLLYQTGLDKILPQLGFNVAIQGEVMGEGIQGNREKLKGHQLFVFDIFDIDRAMYLNPTSRRIVMDRMIQKGFSGEHVPVLHDRKMIPSDNIDDLLLFAEGPSLNHDIREGLVFKRHDGQFSWKAISTKFLLKSE